MLFGKKKANYVLALRKSKGLENKTPQEVIEGLEFVLESELLKSDSEFTSVHFASVYTDGWAILWNQTTVENPPMARCHVPFEVVVAADAKAIKLRDPATDMVYAVALALETYCDRVEFSGHTLLAGCLDVHASDVGQCYSDEEGLVVPITTVFRNEPGFSVGISSDKVEGVLLEDVVEFYGRVGVENIEDMSTMLVTDIIRGDMEFPEEPEVL